MDKYSMNYINSEGRTFNVRVTSLSGYKSYRFANALKCIAGLVAEGKTPSDADYDSDPLTSINKIAFLMYDHSFKEVRITTDLDTERKRVKIRVEYGDGLGLRGVSSMDISLEKGE